MVQEWRKIGAKRTKFLDLGLPKFGPPRRILVQVVQPVAAANNQQTQTSVDSSHNQTQLDSQDDVKEARQD